MSITIDGNNLVFDGTLTVTNFTNPANGVCTLVLTPSGGVGTLPALVNGQPGLPPTLTLGTVTTLSAGQQAAVSFNQTNAGGPGEASAYTVNFQIPQGAKGDPGTNSTLAGSSDLTGTATVGSIPIVTGTSPTAFQYRALPFAFVVTPSSITTAAGTGQQTIQLCSVTVAAQSFAWVPMCFAEATVAGTANTVVQLQATMSASPRSGDVVGTRTGISGAATQQLTMIPSFGALMGPSQAYGVVPANTTATILLKATETATTSDSWTITNSTVSFSVMGLPVS